MENKAIRSNIHRFTSNHALPVLMTAMMKHRIRDLDNDTECKLDEFLDDVKKSD